ALGPPWQEHPHVARRPPRLAILADPAHREEFRLAYLFGREAAALGWRWDVVGPENLAVDDGVPSAYGEPVDIVLRQYPAEYLHERPAAAALLEAARDGQLRWLHDPRRVAAASRSPGPRGRAMSTGASISPGARCQVSARGFSRLP